MAFFRIEREQPSDFLHCDCEKSIRPLPRDTTLTNLEFRGCAENILIFSLKLNTGMSVWLAAATSLGKLH